MYCSNCGREIKETDKFCSECGSACVVEEYESVDQTKKSKFNLFMEKNFLANGTISYKTAGRVYSCGVILIQLISCILLICLGDDFGISIVSLIFMLLDWYFLSKQGIKGIWKIWGFFAIPVYLWIRECKSDKDYKWPIISTVISAIAIIVIMRTTVIEIITPTEYGGTEVQHTENERIENTYGGQDFVIDTIITVDFDTENYSCPKYVTVEKDEIHAVSPNLYIPNTGIYVYEANILGNKIPSTVTVNVDLINGITFTEKLLDVVCYGEYYMSGPSNEDILVKKYTENILGKETQTVEMITLNKTYECSNGSIIVSPPYNYTITVAAGTFENCVCMITKESEEENYTAIYYAPLVGAVLELHNDEFLRENYGVEWYVYSELVDLNNMLGVQSQNNEENYSIWLNGRRCVYWDENGNEHIIQIFSVNNDMEIVVAIDGKEEINLPVWAIVENKIYAYASEEQNYYIEYDTENLYSLYMRSDLYEGECIFLPDSEEDVEFE